MASYLTFVVEDDDMAVAVKDMFNLLGNPHSTGWGDKTGALGVAIATACSNPTITPYGS